MNVLSQVIGTFCGLIVTIPSGSKYPSSLFIGEEKPGAEGIFFWSRLRCTSYLQN